MPEDEASQSIKEGPAEASGLNDVKTVDTPGEDSAPSPQGYRPPLPPRPSNLSLLHGDTLPRGRVHENRTTSSAHLQSLATTAVSRTDVQTKAYQDGSSGTVAASGDSLPSERLSSTYGSTRRLKNVSGSEAGDTASIKSSAPTVGRGGENESLLGEIFGTAQDVPTWKLLAGDEEAPGAADMLKYENYAIDAEFYREFDPIKSSTEAGADEGRS